MSNSYFKKTLYGLNKGGTFKVWTIEAYPADHNNAVGCPFIYIEYGVEGGKMSSKTEEVKEGKQGRTAYEQAVMQAQARIKKQMDKNYRETKNELENIPLIAMLAKDHNKDGKEEIVNKGVYVSDKLDGVRCIAKMTDDYVVTLESRTGQPYSLPHIEEELWNIMVPGEVLDGELYLHGPALQEIQSAVERTDPQAKIEEAQRRIDKSVGKDGVDWDKLKAQLSEAIEIARIRPLLEFHVFDIIDPDEDEYFVDRLDRLIDYSKRFPFESKIVRVEYQFVQFMDELLAAHADAVERGYEGIMYRTFDGVYESGKRSRGLWKYKEFVDSEFLIRGTEKDKQGCIVFILENNLAYNSFNCVLGDLNWRLAVADDDFTGQYMTVQYQSRFKKTLLPQFPTGKAIRKGSVINGEFVPEV